MRYYIIFIISYVSYITIKHITWYDAQTVEVRGTGQVNLESQIDEVKQLLRKCDISKAKAYARLMSIKESKFFPESLSVQ